MELHKVLMPLCSLNVFILHYDPRRDHELLCFLVSNLLSLTVLLDLNCTCELLHAIESGNSLMLLCTSSKV